MPNVIRCRFHPEGRLGNHMFQVLIAKIVHQRVPEALFDCDALPEWDMQASAMPPVEKPKEKIIFDTHVIPFEDTIDRLKKSISIELEIASLSTRMEYFGNALELARTIFPPPAIKTGFDNRFLVINIRTGDIYRGLHRNYTLLPIDFYRRILDRSGLEPVFVGEIEDNEYCNALMRFFPSAQFFTGGPMNDFHMLRTSHNILVAVSTFSWIAAWLSESAKRIILPAIGLLNPMDRPDIDLLPARDSRFEIYRFPREIWTGTDEQIAGKIHGRSDPNRVWLPAAFKAESVLRCWRQGCLPRGLSHWRSLSSCLC